ncbi:LacI family DNA-binding transcriptional regulator [Granulicella cerasi]|nr:LacI family DNA-binding transcriptional regulator [Granulicella cerasi]
MKSKSETSSRKPISQKALAEYLKLSPSTVSLVMNDAPRAQLIPEATRRRILDAAAEFDYRPDFYARYLYSKRSYTVAVVLPSVGEQWAAAILAGVDRKLNEAGYLYFTANHHGDTKLIHDLPRRLLERAVEGFLFINTDVDSNVGKPAMMIGSQASGDGTPRLALNNRRGGELAFEHLYELGHRKIAVVKGHPWRNAAMDRFEGIQNAASRLGAKIRPELVRELRSGNSPQEPTAHEEGYACAKSLIDSGESFTALICFNDSTALGAMRAFQEQGRKIPDDISIVGFDDVESAAYVMPSLSTLRQPFMEMGEAAAAGLLDLIEGREAPPADRRLDPVLIQRESTRAPKR